MKNLVLGLLIVFFAAPSFAADQSATGKGATGRGESVFDRVMKTQTLRCGYWNWPPLYMVDPNTNQTSGVFKDLMTEFSRVSGVKVEWVQEVHFDNLITDLNSKKIDAVCAGTWPSAQRAKFIRFSSPVFYITLNAYKRADDARFDGDKASIDSPDVTVVAMDGEMSTEIYKTDFPKAKLMAIPQIAGSATELLLNVETGKGDVTFADSVGAGEFIKNNPGKVAAVKLDRPLRLMPNTIAIAGDGERLQDFVNATLQEMHNSGVVERILEKYDEDYPGALIRVANPYQ